MPAEFRIVLDTSILLRGILNIHSTAGRVVDLCDRRMVVLLLSRPVLAEYRAVMTDEEIVRRYPELTHDKTSVLLRRLRFVADYHRSVAVTFEFARDPKDQKFIELAIAGNALFLITGDQDLLSLAHGHGDAAKRLRQRAPSLNVVNAAEFLDHYAAFSAI